MDVNTFVRTLVMCVFTKQLGPYHPNPSQFIAYLAFRGQECPRCMRFLGWETGLESPPKRSFNNMQGTAGTVSTWKALLNPLTDRGMDRGSSTADDPLLKVHLLPL